MVNNEIITVRNFVSKYANVNAGSQRIDISNLNLLGSTAPNYYIMPVRPIMGTISKKDITATSLAPITLILDTVLLLGVK